MVNLVQILDPRAERPESGGKPLPVLNDLADKTLAILSNGWTSMDRISEHLAEMLKSRYGVAKIVNASMPVSSGADIATLDMIAREAHCAIVGLAN